MIRLATKYALRIAITVTAARMFPMVAFRVSARRWAHRPALNDNWPLEAWQG